ncbi:MAG: GtrA family protein [Exilispira sp.]|jgi:putative flippase GtrA|nr:GtrA family protein [Exilispira sp.]
MEKGKIIIFFNKHFHRIYNSKFIRFSITGGLGTVTNLVIFYIICDLLKQPSNLGAIVAFIFAVTQNYFINHFWTFKDYSKKKKVSFPDYIKFVGVAILGLAVNLLVLNLLLFFFKFPLKVIAQTIGILVGLFFNYIGSDKFVFKKQK